MLKYENGGFLPASLPESGEKITACYTRLSHEDELDGESGSVLNQRDFLLKYCTEHHFPHVRFFSDDGYSGTNFDRPGFAEMMDLVEQGRVGAILVKDHSRLGRNRLKVGALMEQFSEDYDVRYIAVADGIDSNKGLDDMVAVRELFNEFYPRDTSKKIRAVFTSKGNSGQRLCTHIPYGYTGDKYGWEIDEEAAAVVQRIFEWCIAGLGPSQIAKRLKTERVLTPSAYNASLGRPCYRSAPDPYGWAPDVVAKMLERMEYTGCTVNFKTVKKSYKSKKILNNPPEKWKVFPNTHPAIIDQETWERVQELRSHKRRPNRTGKPGLFSGVAYCADCGAKLYYQTCVSVGKRNQQHYICSHYQAHTAACTAHYIRERALSEVVLEHLRETVEYVREYETEFVQIIMDKSRSEQKKELAQKRRELAQAERRVDELDGLFQRIYEDMASGKLSEERFTKLSASYESEQHALSDKIRVWRAELEAEQAQAVNVEQFIALVKRYVEIKELTPPIVNEFIKRVNVHAPEKQNGHRTQQIDIEYNFIGVLLDFSSKAMSA